MPGDYGKDPKLILYGRSTYAGDNCQESDLLTSVQVRSYPYVSNMEKEYYVEVSDAAVVIGESAISKYTCTPSVTPNVAFSLRYVSCVDEAGEVLFGDIKKHLGTEIDLDIDFSANQMVIKNVTVAMDRISAESCSFKPTTVAPTTAAPTTQPPTPEPTPKPTPKPTTPAPTPEPTPKPTPKPTPAPTQPPTPKPTPKPTPAPTQPPTPKPTPKPTPAPTQPPTPAPTPKPTAQPTPKPKSSMPWIIGGVIAILIGFAIVFSIVANKNKKEKAEEEKPLV